MPIDGVTGILEDSLQSLWEYFIAYLQRCEFGSNQSADVLSKNYKSNKYKFLWYVINFDNKEGSLFYGTETSISENSILLMFSRDDIFESFTNMD